MREERMKGTAPRKQEAYRSPVKRSVQRHTRVTRVINVLQQRFPQIRMTIDLLHVEGERLARLCGELSHPCCFQIHSDGVGRHLKHAAFCVALRTTNGKQFFQSGEGAGHMFAVRALVNERARCRKIERTGEQHFMRQAVHFVDLFRRRVVTLHANILHAFHELNQPFAHQRFHRREANATATHHRCGDAVSRRR